MKLNVVNKENKKVETLEVPEVMFARTWNPDLVHQVVRALQESRRAPLAHAKDRSEVRGGGKKPWRQKGTGRARHGSSRSPLWSGGGATFGPSRERNFIKKINKKMKRVALFSVLSKKLEDGEVVVVDELGIKEPSTKTCARVLGVLREDAKTSTLLITKEGEKNIVLSGRNIPKNDVTYPSGINILECLNHKVLVFEKQALEEFIERQTGEKLKDKS